MATGSPQCYAVAMKTALPLTAVLLLAACQTATLEPLPPPPPGMKPVPMTRALYGCADGHTIEMRFFPEQGVGVLIRHGQNHELQQQPAASGFHYTNGPIGVRGQGDALTLEIGRRAPIACQVKVRG